jgi:hypothetical protein
MSSAVKTIVKVASIAGAIYGGYALAAGMASATAATGGATTLGTVTGESLAGSAMTSVAPSSGGLSLGAAATASDSVGATLLSSAKGLISSKAMQIGGLAMQGLGQMQAKVAGQEAADAEKEAARKQARIQEAQAQRERIAQLRENYRTQGSMEARAANVGIQQSGTSSVVTGQSSLSTQLGTNLADITGRLEAARSVGRSQTKVFTATNEQSGWKSFADLGTNLFSNADRYSSIFKPLKINEVA